MKKAALGLINAPAGNGGGRLIPSHAAIYVAKTINPPMAWQLRVLGKRRAPAAITRNSLD
jgi:hypothetical protein